MTEGNYHCDGCLLLRNKYEDGLNIYGDVYYCDDCAKEKEPLVTNRDSERQVK